MIYDYDDIDQEDVREFAKIDLRPFFRLVIAIALTVAVLVYFNS